MCAVKLLEKRLVIRNIRTVYGNALVPLVRGYKFCIVMLAKPPYEALDIVYILTVCEKRGIYLFREKRRKLLCFIVGKSLFVGKSVDFFEISLLFCPLSVYPFFITPTPFAYIVAKKIKRLAFS